MRAQVNVNSILRGGGSLLDQALVSGGNFLTIAVCAHALPLSEQGKFTYAFASYMALLLLNVAGIFQGGAVRAPAQEGGYQVFLARLQLLQAIALSTLVCFLWFGAGETLGWQATENELILLFAFLLMQQLADFDRRAAYIFAGTRRVVMSSAAVYPLRIVGLLLASPDTLTEVLAVLIVSAMVPAVITAYVATRGGAAGTSSWIQAAKEHLAYSKMFIAGAPLGWAWSYFPIFMLGTIHGKEQAALLASIRGITNIANVLMEQLETRVVADWARVHHGDGRNVMDAAAKRMFKLGIAIWLPGMVLVAQLGEEIVAIVLGDLYSPYWHLLVIGWLGYGVYFMARIYGVQHRALGANRVEFVGNLGGLLAALVAGLILIPEQQATGAAWAYVIIACGMLVSQVLAMKRRG